MHGKFYLVRSLCSGSNLCIRLRERDPILGIVNLELKHLLQDASEVTRLFALEEGIGFGYVQIIWNWSQE